jgi:hypothetical protein
MAYNTAWKFETTISVQSLGAAQGDTVIVAGHSLGHQKSVKGKSPTKPDRDFEAVRKRGARSGNPRRSGNCHMVVSSAIADHGMGVGKYFMLNAAVPSEAYAPALWDVSVDNMLVHEAWRLYTNVCWSARWHEFFNPQTDTRGRLTWKDRFAAVAANTAVYNFWSSGDEVFELYDGTPFSGSNIQDLNRYAWHKQETHKGRGALDPAGTSWAGWGFREFAVMTQTGLQLQPYTPTRPRSSRRHPGH